MVNKTINDVSLKNLTFQTGQKSGTEGVINYPKKYTHSVPLYFSCLKSQTF